MKYSKLSLMGYLIGAFVILSGIIRYQIIFEDWFRFLTAVAIGFIIYIFSYLYNWMRMTDKKLDKLDERIDSVVLFWTKQERNANKERMMERMVGGIANYEDED